MVLRALIVGGGAAAAIALGAPSTASHESRAPRVQGTHTDVVANAIGVGRGRVRLLALPGGGRMAARCASGSRLVASFIPHGPSRTIGVVVGSPERAPLSRFSATTRPFAAGARGPTASQTWQLVEPAEPFTRVTTVQVSSQPGPGGGCWVAAQAIATTVCHGPPSTACVTNAARLELPRHPYMGVACKQANTIGCDKVGLAVWLRRPAAKLEAWIGRRHIVLRRVGGRNGPPTYYGFLHHAGLRGGPLAVHPHRPTFAIVRIRATYPDRTRRSATVKVGLAPGWG
jgi:hypothetical protein